MKVSDLMTRYVEFIELDALVKDAAVLMGEIEVGCLPVGSPERIEGVITDRDILYRVVAKGLDCGSVRVSEAISRPVVSCSPDDAVQAAMDRMAANQIRRLAVRDPAGAVVGWLTLGDLSRRLVVENAQFQAALRDLTETQQTPSPAVSPLEAAHDGGRQRQADG